MYGKSVRLELGGVNGFSEELNLHYVHQTDLALKRDAVTSVPCIPLDLAPLYCSAVATGWNQGNSVATWWFMPTFETVDFYSAVCLDKPTHHTSVDFEMTTIRSTIHLFGTSTSQNSYDLNFDSKGDCSTNELSQFADAGNRVSRFCVIFVI